MGVNFTDKYSLLHFSVGVVTYFWSVPLLFAFILHSIFEYGENTKTGMKIINDFFVNRNYEKYNIPFTWPGGKDKPDSLINILGDTFYFIAGWVLSYTIDF